MRDDAWRKLTDREDRAIWEKVRSKLSFNPPRQPGYHAPAPSLTYSVKAAYGTEADELCSDLDSKALKIFKGATSPDDFLLALDKHHACYRFYPHLMTKADGDDWPISAMPDGDYHLFLEKDFRFGWLGHPWDMTICLFGKPLLEQVKIHRPRLFRNPVQRNEKF